MVKHWNGLSEEVIDSPSPEVLRDMDMWHLWTWFTSGLGTAGLPV